MSVIPIIITLLCTIPAPRNVEVGEGYALTSVNTAVFRGSSLVSHGDKQYIAYYDPEGRVVVGRRRLGEDAWQLHTTQYTGNVRDAHCVISLGVDGTGRLHLSFDHHGHPLRYCRSVEPDSLTFGEMEPMIGEMEQDVTYPEFYTLPSGNLLFAYRTGVSGRGNLVMNTYDVASGKWSRLHDVLIDGEGERNAYWQLYVDPSGRIHLSWVWRETWMVETNHDLCYACSRDGGATWERADGSPYALPITLSTAERAWSIPERSELINQTSMTADGEGCPYIATYWREQGDSVPQYRLVWHDGSAWRMAEVGHRSTPFTLAGGGTKMIPIARPRIACDGKNAYYIIRDAERGSRVTLAYTDSIGAAPWTTADVTDFPVGAWEPTFDINLWNTQRRLHIFVQPTLQGDGERVADSENKSSMVSVLEIF